jgi:hypothetical protein
MTPESWAKPGALWGQTVRFFEVNEDDTAKQLRDIIFVYGDEKLVQRDILNLRLPKPEDVAVFTARIETYRPANPKADVDNVLDRLGWIVSDALDLTEKDLELIIKNLMTDPLFSHMVAWYPFQIKAVPGGSWQSCPRPTGISRREGRGLENGPNFAPMALLPSTAAVRRCPKKPFKISRYANHLGAATLWGARGRESESPRPDHFMN